MGFSLSKKQQKFLERIDTSCREIRPYEDKAYHAEERNDRAIPLFGKIVMLGCLIVRKYGGLGLDMLSRLQLNG